MASEPSPAQRAVQITFVLKGHLKNVQISYIRAAALLAKVRDEGLYRALKHDSMESYAAERLGLQRAALYRYLQIHDWIRRSHREWLAHSALDRLNAASGALARAVRLANVGGIRLAAIGRKSLPG